MPRPRLPAGARAVAAGLALLGATGVALAGCDDGGDGAGGLGWDDRLAPLAEFVEEARGLRFERPVPVEFLDADGFAARVRDDQELDDEDRRELADTAAVFRALGLVGRDVDLERELRSLHADGTLAFYDYDEEQIVVDGTDLTPQVRSTVVHELTHALQDQHFDLSRLEDLSERGDGGAFEGLVEGDATRIATRYEERELSDDEREQLSDEEAADVAELDVERFPPALAALLSMPYVLGEPFVSAVHANGGQDALDRAFREPPLRDEALLDPLTFLAGDALEEVEEPAVPSGAEEIDRGVFDALGWFLVLAMRIPPLEALDAADGWGADRYVAYRQGGRVCVRISWVGESHRDADELAGAADAWWRRAGTAGGVTRTGDRQVGLESCEPEGDVPLPERSVEDLLALPAVRAGAQAAVLDAGGDDLELARCYANGLVHRLSLDALVADEVEPEVERRVVGIATTCRGSS